ncbi:microfibril-associated glycoprotein 4-like [Anopheles ziemanni]|uniref:microfibril-associated glycoprotein 4-like n=1 Tax=Anopheles coustani TaxID=139045 RepID=UPI0026592019|nr:microfibril-associated glycoprotein 4-like [Anopheles coustani]XP_058177081.1 microfibril-associated glycoprotein 4-like [Anopheles ziemanni]
MEHAAITRDELLQSKLVKLEQTINVTDDTLKEAIRHTEFKLLSTLEALKNDLIGKLDNLQQKQQANHAGLVGDMQKFLDLQADFIKNYTNQVTIPASCKEVPTKVSGKYTIQLEPHQHIPVYCEQGVFGGGWIVFQYRFNGSVDFFRNWVEYRNGFGSLDGEFWLGLEFVYRLTSSRKYELMIELKDRRGNYGYANYDEFKIGSETELYSLKKLGTYDGTAQDSLSTYKGMKFSTKDQDNDNSENHCAIRHGGAWWYRSCTSSNLNGLYTNEPFIRSRGMFWYSFKNDERDLVLTRMMIREVN